MACMESYFKVRSSHARPSVSFYKYGLQFVCIPQHVCGVFVCFFLSVCLCPAHNLLISVEFHQRSWLRSGLVNQVGGGANSLQLLRCSSFSQSLFVCLERKSLLVWPPVTWGSHARASLLVFSALLRVPELDVGLSAFEKVTRLETSKDLPCL